MKVERCPRCGTIAMFTDGRRSSLKELSCKCHYVIALTTDGAIRKFNRWARREARRNEMEGNWK